MMGGARFLPPDATAGIRTLVDEACQDPTRGLPFAHVSLVGDNRRYEPDLLHHQNTPPSRAQGFAQDQIFWLASCTKLVTAIAAMQLVEKGTLELDDADLVERLCPELGAVKVVQPDGNLVAKEGRITLRMLLTHTAGFGYSFLNHPLQDFDEFSGNASDLNQPLVNHPGGGFQYGINMDWAGILIQRASGLALNEYMARHIFDPLDIQDLTMLPSPDMVDRLAGFWQRSSDGVLSPTTCPLSKPLSPGPEESVFQSGGAGLFGSVKEFSKILQCLLNDGASPHTGGRILSPSSVERMFSNQLVSQPDFARRPLPAVKPKLVYPAEDGLFPLCPAEKPQGWGLGFMITPGITGRSDSTAQWSGISNIFWWCDRERGVAGVVGSQISPFVDPRTAELWVRVEQMLYAAVGNADPALEA